MEQKEQANIRDNQTKIIVAQLSKNDIEGDGISPDEFSEEAKASLKEKIREFDEKLKLDKQKLELDKEKARTDASIKRQALKKKPSTTNK